ncbi:unnamed protein product [Effrenium voratum]|uniref:Uncharacterized protein n=1 Tax=Effrenium voratum TaxID=2562239 RepID=A0AA36N7Q1_9DINO|nr:unnamed protein product [Effrenium voratum]CAJ1440957.1 unnamed protein product [Effrenium voratum]
MPARALDVPPELYLSSPNGQQKLGGLYRLEEKHKNGLPVWKRQGEGAEAWIYSGPNGRWYVSGNKAVEESDFQCGRGLLASCGEHRNLMPPMLEEDSWQYKDQYGWSRDSSIRFHVAAPEMPAVLFVASPNAYQKLSGEYRMCEERANGFPVWKRAGSGEAAYLYSGRNGKWYVVGKKVVLDRRFCCSIGGLASSHAHAGLPPDAFAGNHRGWSTRVDKGWHHDEDIRIGTQPFEAPARSLWVTARGRKVTGRFDLSGHFANGFPAYRRAGAGAETWLFSSRLGCWCIGDHTVAQQKFCVSHGSICAEGPHVGRLPQELSPEEWLCPEDDWAPAGISVTTTPPTLPPVMYLISPNGEQRKAGKYQLVKESMANGYPIWKSLPDGRDMLYTGNDGCWYFVGAREVPHFDGAFGALRSHVHGGVLPHEVGAGWLLREQGWQLDREVSVWLAPPKAPRQMYLASRSGHQRLAGTYSLLEGQSAHNLPIWKREGGAGEALYLYGGSDGRWHVGDSQAEKRHFDTDLGLLRSQAHGAAMPGMLLWERRCEDGFLADPAVTLTRPPEYPQEISILSPSKQQKVSGQYLLTDGWANGQRLWKRLGHGEELWLYSGHSGHWQVGGVKAAEKGFNCSLGNLCSAEPHGGLLPFQDAGGWQARDASGWELSEVQVLRGPFSCPQVLHLVGDEPGVFELQGEYMNGWPVWKCSERDRQDAWLYSTWDGFWCVSSEVFQRLSHCAVGALASCQPHGGAGPHLCDAWQARTSGGWGASGCLLQTSPPESPSVLHVEAEAETSVTGKYWKLEGELINHRHVWRHSDSKDGPLLYSLADGSWHLNAAEPAAGALRVSALKKGPMLGIYRAGDKSWVKQ